MAEVQEQLTVSSTSDTEASVSAVADGQEARRESEIETAELPGVSRESNSGSPPREAQVAIFEHPQSSRQRMLDAAEAELNELSELGQGEQAPGDIDLAEVRRVATADAIEAARRQQQGRDSYYQQQQAQHFSNPQAEIQELRAELLPTFQQKVKALIADADPAKLQEAASIPLSSNLLDCLLTLPGGPESTVFLMRNPQEVRKLSALPEHMAVAQIAALANRLNPALQRRPSQAPPPIRPIGGSATPAAVDLANADYQTYKREREKQIKARRR
jgi:hypothetical protein